MATYLAYHDAERVALIEPVEGEALVAAKLKSRSGHATLDDDLAACARLIASVHVAPVTIGPERTVERELTALRAS